MALAQDILCRFEDILIEILSTVWLSNLSPQERRTFLRYVPLVCKPWFQVCEHICSTSVYTASARPDLFEPVSVKHLTGMPILEIITRVYIRQLPSPKSPTTNRHLEISHHLALGYQDTGYAALSGTQGIAARALPASLLPNSIDTFRHLEYMPNLHSLVMEYRAQCDTDTAPLHCATFDVVHVDVEYHFCSHRNTSGHGNSGSHPSSTQYWVAEELGLLPTSVSRAMKRKDLLNMLPDLTLVSFSSPHVSTDCDDPVILRAIGDLISMGAGSVSTSKADDGRAIVVKVHNGLQCLKGRRFALVHGALSKNTCTTYDHIPTSQQRPIPSPHRQSFQCNSNGTFPPLPISVRGTAIALVVNLGGVDLSGGDSTGGCISGLREARIFSKSSSM